MTLSELSMQSYEDSHRNYFLTLVEELLRDNLSKADYSISDLCDELNISRSTLHRRITQYSNMSTTHYLRHIRLKHSKYLLHNTNLHVAEIAYKVGFSDPNYFTRTFVREFGFTPSKFRIDPITTSFET